MTYAITEEQIERYVERRNTEEAENRQFLNSPSTWGQYSQSEKQTEAKRELERLAAQRRGRCPKCHGEGTVCRRGMAGEIDTLCASCGEFLYTNFSLSMII